MAGKKRSRRKSSSRRRSARPRRRVARSRRRATKPRRRATRSRRRVAGRTLFAPPRYKKYASIVSLKSPSAARQSVRKLLAEYRKARTKRKKTRIKRVIQLAYARAKVMSRNPRLKASTRREKARVAKVYYNALKRLGAVGR